MQLLIFYPGWTPFLRLLQGTDWTLPLGCVLSKSDSALMSETLFSGIVFGEVHLFILQLFCGTVRKPEASGVTFVVFGLERNFWIFLLCAISRNLSGGQKNSVHWVGFWPHEEDDHHLS